MSGGGTGPENPVDSTTDLRTLSGIAYRNSPGGSGPREAGPVVSVRRRYGASETGLAVEGFEHGMHVTANPF